MTIIMVMARRRSYALVYAPAVKRHLRAIVVQYHSLTRDTIEEQLRTEPGVETRNRKPLRQPAALAAEWELRFGPDNRFRVFYAIDPEALEVLILAIGVKLRDRLLIGG